MDTENFELVTRIQGAGNSNIETKYHYLDIKVAEGDVYYRLKQFDFDGKETILSLVSVNMSSNGDLIGSVIVNDNSLLVEMGQLDQSTVVSLLDASGKLIQMVSKNDLNTNQIQFNMSGLSHGMYIIRIEQANIMESVKVIF
jgi:hypothetical protein